MRNLKEAQDVLQQAYNGQEIDTTRVFDTLDPLTLHIVYYDSGLAQHPEIQAFLHQHPESPFTRLIVALRDARSSDYSKETLDKMYGLTGISG